MKNVSANKFMLAAFLALAVMACSSAAKNTAVNANEANGLTANSNFSVPPEISGRKGAAQIIAPEALVADLYKQHDANKSPFFQTKSRALIDKYFTKATADLIWNDLKNTPDGEVGAIEFDPLYDAQDTEIKGFKISKSEIDGDKAEVFATFTNFGDKVRIGFELVRKKSVWKIEDIKYKDGQTLVETYRNK